MTKSNIGLIGLGTMGAMLALNIAENGFGISVFNRTTSTMKTFFDNAGELADKITPCETLEALIETIEKPRTIILMVPAGTAVDEQIATLRPLLDADDMIVDAGNANFNDTNRRASEAAAAGVPFLGIGVSGGEEGARYGPSIMGGGPEESWNRVAHILTAISAKYEGNACATWMGAGGAGHFVKTVHNGIEYADMQMIAEAYGVMRDGMGMDAGQCAETFARWNKGPLQSYLTEISAEVSAAIDPKTGQAMLDVILDRAGQKGTGRWTAIEAQHLAAPIPVIEAAVTARNLSAQLTTRAEGDALSLDDLEQALIAGKILCYTQGFALLSAANPVFGWSLPLPEVARVWREGCIIRSSMLNDMASALSDAPDRNLMFAPFFTDLLKSNHSALRHSVSTGMRHGLPMPALASALSYFDIMRTARSTANMIQAQRDFFGAHSFERFDATGAHHGPWGGH